MHFIGHIPTPTVYRGGVCAGISYAWKDQYARKTSHPAAASQRLSLCDLHEGSEVVEVDWLESRV
jgi:hypothetical protein